MPGIAAFFVVAPCPIHGAMVALLRHRVGWFGSDGYDWVWRVGEEAGGEVGAMFYLR